MQGRAVLLVTHDSELVARTADRVLLLDRGRVVAAGHPRAVLPDTPFAPQISQLLGGAFLTVADVLAVLPASRRTAVEVEAMRRWRTTIVLAVTSLIGVAAFLSPFWLARAQTTGADRTAHGGDAPLLFAVIGVLCLVVLLIETGGGADPDAKRVALLGVLVAANAALRLIPGIFGASPIFFLPICVGFVWGPSFGFLLGAASIAVSGLLTGGIGPWLPFQMMTLGWVGLTAGVVGALTPSRPRAPALPQWGRGRREMACAIFPVLSPQFL